MNKNTIKKRVKTDRVKTICVNWLAEKYDVDRNYIYGIIKGTYKPDYADMVKRDYRDKYEEVKELFN